MLKIEGLTKVFHADARRRLARRGVRLETADGVRRVRAVDNVDLEVHEGEMFTLLGPSGCGKTTTLRSIAGLDRPEAGVITIDGRTTFAHRPGRRDVNIPADARGLGMVFQSYAIWPHMTVFANAAFPLEAQPRRRRPGRQAIADRVMRVLEVMELERYAERRATQLSGGQQQRLALARAIVTEPPLLLLDEPLSNLDAKLRESLRFELKRLQRDLGITAVYVTHDQTEALSLSSRIAVMNQGRVEQIGSPREIYERPASRFVADFIGTSNFITGTVTSRQGELVGLNTTEGRLAVRSAVPLREGQQVTVAIRPEAVEVAPDRAAAPGTNEWQGTVDNRAYLGDSADHVVTVGKIGFRTRSAAAVSLAPGTKVFLRMDPDRFTVIPDD